MLLRIEMRLSDREAKETIKLAALVAQETKGISVGYDDVPNAFSKQDYRDGGAIGVTMTKNETGLTCNINMAITENMYMWILDKYSKITRACILMFQAVQGLNSPPPKDSAEEIEALKASVR